ncbi:MAG: DUF1565 domain-containing protein, partial [Candidatus Altiarchaeota archaeon]|nr:DUF1565 domain-containing protein [Candidatus Altiarchaeota archaeon]
MDPNNKKIRFYSFMIISLAIIISPSALANTLYVDNDGGNGLQTGCSDAYTRDNNDISHPFCTLQKAASVAVAGDMVLIRGGIYNAYAGTGNDVLWPKHSGTAENPVVFKSYRGEEVVLGEGEASYPNDDWASIARGVITLKDVDNIVIDGLTIRNVAGWIFARNCSNIVIKNCVFDKALYDAKGTARFIEVNYSRVMNNVFRNATFDCLQIIDSNYNIIQNNTFNISKHALLAIRCGNFNVIRNNKFTNPWFENGMAEKLIEVYDCKVDTRTPDNPAYLPEPHYDSTKYNLFEDNYFGYHPDYSPALAKGSRTSGIQFSGQNTIIRNNIFSNPPRDP